MLHLILGTAGTGKTTLLHERIHACVKKGQKVILLVPEQYSFESEKALYRRLGPKDALLVEVLSFTRLCDRIFRELGGIAGVYMDDTAKYLLMNVALGELDGTLKTYQKNIGSAAFVASMCETVSELKTAGVTAEQLGKLSAATEDRAFSEKLADIALIFQAFEAVSSRGYLDADDNLARACKKLGEAPFFQQYSVFIDGFMAFMGAEWRMLAHILEDSVDTTVALTCHRYDDPAKTGVFACVTKTAQRFVRTAKSLGTKVAAPVVLDEAKRYVNPALSAIAREYSHLRTEMCAFVPSGVQIVPCEDIYDETEYVAAQISALVREQGYRYRDIAVIARGLDAYQVPVQTIFSRFDIPFFMDQRQDIQVYPLVSGLLCALDAVRTGYRPEFVLALAKNSISGISALDAGLLENYCFTWGISGKDWRAPFLNNPEGMVESMSEHAAAQLERLNELRLQLITPLEQLWAALRDPDGLAFAKGIFTYLDQIGAVEHLQQSASHMPKTEAKIFLETGAQIWDVLIGILDVFGGALRKLHLPLVKLIDLLRLSLAATDIGSLPQTIDQVLVGMADRIRPNEPKAVFVIGVNEGLFPVWSSASGIFSSVERDRLSKLGVDLLRTPEQHALFEQYYVYFALTQASERMYVSYPVCDGAGGGLAPSTVIAKLAEIIGEQSLAPAALLAGRARVNNLKTAFDYVTRNWNTPDMSQISLREYLRKVDARKISQAGQFAGKTEFRLATAQNAQALFGRQMHLSPSRVEQFYNCPFQFFCQNGLKLRKRRKVEYNPLESGSLIHLVLERIVKKYGGKGLSGLKEAELKAEISQIISDNLGTKIQDFDGMPARFKYLFHRLVGTLVRLIKRLAVEFAQSDFEPKAFELPIGPEENVQPLRLCTEDGTSVIIEGVVDRMDILEKDGVSYVRVVDYKSGAKTFELSDVYYGLNMQMLIYLFTICSQPDESGNVPLPAGVLYMPARDNILSIPRGAAIQDIEQEQVKKLRMNGILLENREVLSAMEPDLAGVFIPVKAKKDGGYSSASSLANLAQMGIIRRQVETLIIRMADSLHQGGIGAVPVAAGTGEADMPCRYCDYGGICGHEDEDDVRRISPMKPAQAIEKMQGEGESEDAAKTELDTGTAGRD